MANLSDLFGVTGSVGAPDAGSVLLQRVYASRGIYDYVPGSPIAAGKYTIKCSGGSRGVFRVGAAGAGVEIRGNESQAVLDIPSTTDGITMSFENYDAEPSFQLRELPRFVPGVNGTTTWQTYANSRTIASDPTGRTQVQVTGNAGTGILVSKDFGNTWHTVGTFVTLNTQQTNSTNESYSVQYFRDRFIVAGGPTTAQSFAISSFNGFDWNYIGDSNLTNIRVAEINATPANAASATVYVAGRHTTTNNLVYSVDGINFITATNPSGWSGNVVGILWDGTQFIAWNDAATQQITTSTDGITWTAAVNSPITIRSMVRIGSTYWAVTTGGVINSSANLTSWTTTATLSTATLTNHRLTTVGSTLVYYDPNNLNVRTSTDGTNWTIRLTGLTANGIVNTDALGKTWYVQNTVAGARYTIDNNNAISWNFINHPNIAQANNVVVYGAGTWVVGKSNGNLMSSTNLYDWTDRTTLSGGVNISTNAYTNGQFSNGRFMLIGQGGSVVTSVDGATFTRLHTAGSANGPANATINGISYGGTSPVWVIGNANGQIYTSADDGVTWTLRFTAATSVNDIAWDGTGLFVAVCNSGNIYTSTDGTTWVLRTGTAGGTSVGLAGQNLAGVNLNNVAFGNGIWLAVGDSGSTITSTDGLEWRTNVKNSSWYQAGNLTRVRFINGRFRIVGANGYFANSTNGIDFFQTHSGHGTNAVTDVAYDGSSRWMLVSSSTAITVSTDNTATYFSTADITTFATPGTNYNVAYDNNKYIILNTTGIYRTSDWISFDPPVTNAYASGSALSDIVSGNGVMVAMGTNSITMRSSDGLNWAVCKKVTRNDEQRASNIMYEDGRFVKYHQPTATISISNNGETWSNYYTFPRNFFTTNVWPTNLKKITGVWVVWNNSNSSGWYGYNREMLTDRFNWFRNSIGSNAIYDIEGTDNLFVWHTSGTTIVNTSLHQSSNNVTTSMGAGNATLCIVALEESWSNQKFDGALSFSIAGKIFSQDTSGNIHEIIMTPQSRPASTGAYSSQTQLRHLASARTLALATTTSPNGFGYTGNGRIQRSGNMFIIPTGTSGRYYEVSAIDPATFSIYSSTVSTIN